MPRSSSPRAPHGAVQGLVALAATVVALAGVAVVATGTGSPTPTAVAQPAELALVSPAPVPVAQARRDAQANRLAAGPLVLSARSLVRPAGESTAQRQARLLESVAYPWRDLGWTIRLLGPQRGYQGLASPRDRTISVYVRPGQSDADLLRVLGHELGHAVDLTYGTPERRAQWRALRGLPATAPWFPCARCTDYASGAGDFAEVFATYLLGPGEFRSRLAGQPSARQLYDLGYLFWP